MLSIIVVTLKGVFRDKVYRGLLLTGIIFLLIPSVSSLSMRQVTELSLTLSLSLISFLLLMLSLFLGGTSLWKDMERRYTISVLGLPISRPTYIVGKFLGIAAFLFLTAVVLGAVCVSVVKYVSDVYPPDRPVVWSYVLLAVSFDALKYALLVSCAFLLSTVSTSFFLPIFGTISTFFVGSATQEVYEYVHSAAGMAFPPFMKGIVTVLYYVLPNFSAFDLKVNAIYGVPPSFAGLGLTFGYFLLYVAIAMTLSSIIFSRREFL